MQIFPENFIQHGKTPAVGQKPTAGVFIFGMPRTQKRSPPYRPGYKIHRTPCKNNSIFALILPLSARFRGVFLSGRLGRGSAVDWLFVFYRVVIDLDLGPCRALFVFYLTLSQGGDGLWLCLFPAARKGFRFVQT
ncbi:MAG: hypothetical protein ACOYKJ_00520 [Candidatus Howiella sp.]